MTGTGDIKSTVEEGNFDTYTGQVALTDYAYPQPTIPGCISPAGMGSIRAAAAEVIQKHMAAHSQEIALKQELERIGLNYFFIRLADGVTAAERYLFDYLSDNAAQDEDTE